MAIYAYRAKTMTGKDKKGKIEAKDEEHLMVLFREMKLYPLSYQKETVMNRDIELTFLERITLKDLAVFTRQFSAMITAGLTVMTALDILHQQIQNKKLKKAVFEVYEEVQKGSSLSESMRRFPNVFPEILVNMIGAGETSGKLDISLERASEHFEKEHSLNSKIKGAMTYPMVVMVVAVIAISFIVAVVVPGFVSVFDQIGSSLPASTQLLLTLSHVFRSYWYIILIVIAALIGVWKIYSKTPDGRENIDRIKLKIPVFGIINQKVAVARFCRTLATMLDAGLPLLQALDITAGVIGNRYIQNKISVIGDTVGRGSDLATPLEQSKMFPPMVVHMVMVGESTGDMEPLLNKTAGFYDDEVDLLVKQLTTALEPLILIILGGAIAFIVLSVLQPMFSMYEGVSNM